MKTTPRSLVCIGLVFGSMLLLYRDVLWRLVDAWTNDGNYSHGFLIIPLAAYLAWERRAELASARHQPSALGLVVVAGSLAVLGIGVLGAELFLTRISLVGTLAGTALFILGWSHLLILAFPLALLLLMIPIPAIIFNQIAFPLQLLASQFGEGVLTSTQIPVLREGDVLILANTTLEAAEACSGLRSLISLLAPGVVDGYFTDRRTIVRAVLAASTIPIAIVTNGVRVDRPGESLGTGADARAVCHIPDDAGRLAGARIAPAREGCAGDSGRQRLPDTRVLLGAAFGRGTVCRVLAESAPGRCHSLAAQLPARGGVGTAVEDDARHPGRALRDRTDAAPDLDQSVRHPEGARAPAGVVLVSEPRPHRRQ